MKSTTPLFRLCALGVVAILAAGGLAAAQIQDRPATDAPQDRLSVSPFDTERILPGPRDAPESHPCHRIANAYHHALRVSQWLDHATAQADRVGAMLAAQHARVLEALAEGNVTENQTTHLERVLERIERAQILVGERLERLGAASEQVAQRIGVLQGLVERCRDWHSLDGHSADGVEPQGRDLASATGIKGIQRAP